MPSLAALLAGLPALTPADVDRLHLLVGDWQLLSDLSFADLVLWVPVRVGAEGGTQWRAVAQCRPVTAATAFHDDMVGTTATSATSLLLQQAFETGRPFRDRVPTWRDDLHVRQDVIPVRHHDRVIAVLARQVNLATPRTSSRLELTYLQCADDLARMITAGEYPADRVSASGRRGAPRVGDGLLRLDAAGRITYASPNAISALHRIGHVGDVVDHLLVELLTPLLPTGGQVDESLPLVLTGRAPWRSDVEGMTATLSLRAIPLLTDGERTAAIILVRDVSELRRRERELVSKEATIREVHHRVKNNLQTVAALLRLQTRHLASEDARVALGEAMRRVSTIAMVHDNLSTGLGEVVDFDEIMERTVSLSVELTALPTAPVQVRLEGSFGMLNAGSATGLALVLTELVSNAVKHGLRDGGGEVAITALRRGSALRAVVRDNGAGLPANFVPGVSGLGTQIIQALIGGDLQGHIVWNRLPQGTEAVVDITVPEAALFSDRSVAAP